MRLLDRGYATGSEDRVVRFVPPAEFKREANDLMTDMTMQLQALEEKGEDPELTDYISRSMGAFHRMAAMRGLNDIAELALHVARALEGAEHAGSQTARRVAILSLAAVSQIQWLLNPSVEGAGLNARRIVGGLLGKW